MLRICIIGGAGAIGMTAYLIISILILQGKASIISGLIMSMALLVGVPLLFISLSLIDHFLFPPNKTRRTDE